MTPGRVSTPDLGVILDKIASEVTHFNPSAIPHVHHASVNIHPSSIKKGIQFRHFVQSSTVPELVSFLSNQKTITWDKTLQLIDRDPSDVKLIDAVSKIVKMPMTRRSIAIFQDLLEERKMMVKKWTLELVHAYHRLDQKVVQAQISLDATRHKR